MKTVINEHDVIFRNSGDHYYPVGLLIDGMFIANFDDFGSAERRASEICLHYAKPETVSTSSIQDQRRATTDALLAEGERDIPPTHRRYQEFGKHIAEAYRLIGYANWTSQIDSARAIHQSVCVEKRFGLLTEQA
jgi:hypothetical protein